MDYDRWHELANRMSHSRNPFFFWPTISGLKDRETESGWRELGMSYKAARSITEEFLAKANRIKDNENLSEVGRKRKLKELYSEAKEKLSQVSASILAQGRETVLETLTAAEDVAFSTPSNPYRIAVEMEALRALRQLNLRKKGPNLAELEAMPFEVKRAIALAPRIASGVNEYNHELIRKNFASEAGGFELSEARALSDTASKVSEVFELAEVALDQAAGIKRSHPKAEQARQIRAELEAEGKMPTTEGRGDLIATPSHDG